ncbi:MAG: hypothetical protein AAGH48_01740 [Pseudomonadota bacterium]
MTDTALLPLTATAASIGLLHTAAGPDHYLPFGLMARARGWSGAKTLRVTLACGLGHLAGSVALGAAGVAMGLAVGGLEAVEAVRGDLAAYALMVVGGLYAAWSLLRSPSDGLAHSHRASAGAAQGREPSGGGPALPQSVGLWAPGALFLVFVLGPCEPLIPVLMYPAVVHDYFGLAAVVAAFSATTLGTMAALALACRGGLKVIQPAAAKRASHVFAGLGIAACGASIRFLGL